MRVANLSALRTGRIYLPGDSPGTHLLEVFSKYVAIFSIHYIYYLYSYDFFLRKWRCFFPIRCNVENSDFVVFRN